MLKAEIVGNIGQDARSKTINNKEYTEFSVAHSQGKGSDTIWVNVLMFGDGGTLRQYLRKGAKVFVRGDLSLSVYAPRDGQAKAEATIWGREIEVVKFAEGGTLEPQDNDMPF